MIPASNSLPPASRPNVPHHRHSIQVPRVLAGLACLVVSTLAVATHADPVPRPLGGVPVCEASCATLIPCLHDTGATCLLVGDNEVKRKVFVYPFDGENLDVENRKAYDIRHLLDDGDGDKLSDLEALTPMSSGDVLLYAWITKEAANRPSPPSCRSRVTISKPCPSAPTVITWRSSSAPVFAVR